MPTAILYIKVSDGHNTPVDAVLRKLPIHDTVTLIPSPDGLGMDVISQDGAISYRLRCPFGPLERRCIEQYSSTDTWVSCPSINTLIIPKDMNHLIQNRLREPILSHKAVDLEGTVACGPSHTMRIVKFNGDSHLLGQGSNLYRQLGNLAAKDSIEEVTLGILSSGSTFLSCGHWHSLVVQQREHGGAFMFISGDSPLKFSPVTLDYLLEPQEACVLEPSDHIDETLLSGLFIGWRGIELPGGRC